MPTETEHGVLALEAETGAGPPRPRDATNRQRRQELGEGHRADSPAEPSVCVVPAHAWIFEF